jgi:hypothetical protein
LGQWLATLEGRVVAALQAETPLSLIVALHRYCAFFAGTLISKQLQAWMKASTGALL